MYGSRRYQCLFKAWIGWNEQPKERTQPATSCMAQRMKTAAISQTHNFGILSWRTDSLVPKYADHLKCIRTL